MSNNLSLGNFSSLVKPVCAGVLAVGLALSGCSSGGSGGEPQTGGKTGTGATGGGTGTGGATGGATSTGGAPATGGQKADTGGSGGGGTGGQTTGGQTATGGSSAGGGGGAAAGTGGKAPGTGGVPADGGTGDGGSMADAGARPTKVLLYSFSTLDIPSVPAQLTIFKQKLEGWQFQVDESKDPTVFTDANLAKYAAVGMINTCFFPFGANQAGTAESQALQRFVKAGGGLFGTHCADVTFQSTNPAPLYNQLLGGRANSDNYTGNHACRRLVTDHPTTTGLPDTFTYNGNLDNAGFLATDTTVLVKCKFGGGTQADTAVSWVRTEGSGRVFFTSFGKVDTDLSNATIGNAHIIAGLGWVLGR